MEGYEGYLSTIRDKGYVELLRGYFRPSELGLIVNDLLVMNFPDIFDVEFTARLEESLDQVESDQANSLELLTRFYQPFRKDLDAAAEKMVSIKGIGAATDLACPECGSTLHIKIGKNGHFLACSGYPACKYSSDYTRDEKGHIQTAAPPASEATDKVCDKCGKPMVLKHGRYGDFLACSGFPERKYTQCALHQRFGQERRRPVPAGGLRRRARLWEQPAFLVTVLVLPLVYYTVHLVLTGNGTFSGELKAAIASSVVTGVLGGVLGFWLGSSFTTSRTRGMGATPPDGIK